MEAEVSVCNIAEATICSLGHSNVSMHYITTSVAWDVNGLTNGNYDVQELTLNRQVIQLTNGHQTHTPNLRAVTDSLRRTQWRTSVLTVCLQIAVQRLSVFVLLFAFDQAEPAFKKEATRCHCSSQAPLPQAPLP